MHTSLLPEIVESADRAYQTRQSIQNIHESARSLRNAIKDSDDYEIAWRLSRVMFFLGQQSEAETTNRRAEEHFPDAKDSPRSLYDEGVVVARRAVKSKPAHVEGHFWLGVNLALLARQQSTLRAIVHGLQAKRSLRKAIEIDAAYHAAGPLRVLARLQHKLPRWLGGGVMRARENFERAIAIAPANTVNRIYFAELLWEVAETSRTRAELEHLLEAPFDPDWAFEIERDRLLAKVMLGKISNLEPE